jgi:hypothetical protein
MVLCPCSFSYVLLGVGSSRARSVVVLWMAGGVTHIDSFDPKPQAPVEVRGVLGDIATPLPGVRFCETMPRLAELAHELAVIRNFSHDSDDHLLSQVYTLSGRKVNQNQLFTEPNVGSVVSRLQGPANGLPAYIAVPGITRPGPPPHNLFVSGWLGSQYVPYCLGGLPEQPDFAVGEKLYDPTGRGGRIAAARLDDAQGEDAALSRLSRRVELRQSFDQPLRTLDRQDAMVAAERPIPRRLAAVDRRRRPAGSASSICSTEQPEEGAESATDARRSAAGA